MAVVLIGSWLRSVSVVPRLLFPFSRCLGLVSDPSGEIPHYQRHHEHHGEREDVADVRHREGVERVHEEEVE